MSKRKRRAKRYSSDIDVQLTLKGADNEHILAGPSPAFLRNISTYGAGIITNQILVGEYHLFYGPDEHEEQMLYLEAETLSGKLLSIPVRPVWFRLDETDDEYHYFHLGLEFLNGSNNPQVSELKSIVLENLGGEKGFLGKMLLKLWPH